MPTNAVLKQKIDRLTKWLEANSDRLSLDENDRAIDALMTLQKESLADQLANAPLPDVTAAVKALDAAVDGINQESQKLATVAQVVGWIAAAASLIEKALTTAIPF